MSIRILQAVAPFSQSFSPWRATATPFRPFISSPSLSKLPQGLFFRQKNSPSLSKLPQGLFFFGKKLPLDQRGSKRASVRKPWPKGLFQRETQGRCRRLQPASKRDARVFCTLCLFGERDARVPLKTYGVSLIAAAPYPPSQLQRRWGGVPPSR